MDKALKALYAILLLMIALCCLALSFCGDGAK